MLRTDHRYPPTAHAPLGPPVVDYHHEAITMPAELPTIEWLTPSPACGFDACNQGRGEPCRNGCVDLGEAMWINGERVPLTMDPEPPIAYPWVVFAVGATLFALGYALGRGLP